MSPGQGNCGSLCERRAKCRSRVEIVVLSDSDDCGLESDGDDTGGWVQQAPPQPWAQVRF